MLLMGLSFVAGLAIGAAVVVARHDGRLAHPAAALLGFAGDRVEVTRWRGPHRRRPRRRRACSASARRPGAGRCRPSLLAVVVLARRASPSRRCAARCRAGPPKPLRETARLPLEPRRSSATRGRRSSPARVVLVVLAAARSSACGSGSPTRATTPRTPPPARPTTCWPRASAPASTARSSSPPSCPTAPTSPTLDAVTEARGRRPGRRLRHARRSPTTRRARPRRCGGSSRRPHRRTRPPPTSSTRLRERRPPGRRRRAPALDVAVTGQRRRRRRLHRLPRRSGCSCSSAPCWRCRSCC